jgi:adenylate cyclase
VAEERAQRRLAAILAADVVGYSRLMEEDEAGTHSTLRERQKSILEPTIAENHGRIIRLMGDGVLAEFASVTDAVNGAAEMQRRMAAANAGLPEGRHIVLRIGINIGDVIVEGDDLYGDGVNIAARLQALADPGGIYVSRTVFDNVRNKVELQFENLGERTVKNIREPVQLYRVTGVVPVGAVPSDHTAPSKPSIAVLPFENLGGDPEQSYFADGMTNDIILELSRFQDLFVIASHSVFSFKGRQTSLQDVARQLGVRYVVEGSVRRAGERILINVWLMAADIERNLWAERYDFAMAELFAVQDEIVRAIASRLSTRLELSERRRAFRKEPRSLDAYDHYLRGREYWFGWSPDNNLQSQRDFEEAIRLDPTFARAYGALSYALVQAYFCGWSQEPQATLDRAHELAQKAVALGGDDYDNYWSLAVVLLYRHEYERAFAFYARALAANPNYPNLLVDFAEALIYVGRAEEAIARIREAMRFNPIHPDWYDWVLALALYHTGRYAEADVALQAIADPPPAYRPLGVATLIRLGRREEAAAAVRELLRADATYTVAREDLLPYQRPEDREAYVSGLREAGLK